MEHFVKYRNWYYLGTSILFVLIAALPGLPIVFMDECLTTVIAQEKLHAAGKKAKIFRPVIDQVAAVEILSSWQDSVLG